MSWPILAGIPENNTVNPPFLPSQKCLLLTYLHDCIIMKLSEFEFIKLNLTASKLIASKKSCLNCYLKNVHKNVKY